MLEIIAFCNCSDDVLILFREINIIYTLLGTKQIIQAVPHIFWKDFRKSVTKN